MRRFSRLFSGWSLMLTLSSAAFGDTFEIDRSTRQLILKIRLYDYADVPEETLSAAKHEAERVLALAGIALEWFPCSPNDSELSIQSCSRLSGDPTALVLRLLPKSMSRKFPGHKSAFGFALAPSGQGHPIYASAFVDRAEELADRAKHFGEGYPNLAQILGHVIAHEIGHLLLDWSHTPSGIMQAEWKKRQLARMARGKLLFTAKQGRSLRAEVLARESPIR